MKEFKIKSVGTCLGTINKCQREGKHCVGISDDMLQMARDGETLTFYKSIPISACDGIIYTSKGFLWCNKWLIEIFDNYKIDENLFMI